MDIQPATGSEQAAPPTAPDYTAYEAEANARDLGRAAPERPAADPAPPGEQGAATAASADAGSDPASPTEKPKRNLQTRRVEVSDEIAQLQRDLEIRRALREELAALKAPTDAKPSASSPETPTAAEWQRYRQHPNAPKPEDFDTYEDFTTAQAVFVTERVFEARDRRAQLEAASKARTDETGQTIHGFKERIAKAREADPDFESKVDPGLMAIVPAFALRADEPVTPANVLLQECVTSEAAPALLLHFSTPEGHAEWSRIVNQPTPAAMLKAFGRAEARFLSDGSSSSAASAAKPVTSAPAPPTMLGARPPSSPDRARQAVSAGDFRAYEAEANARDLARRR